MSHKAAVLTKVGAPLEDVTVPTPKLGEDEVLVEVQYICLSPLDIWRSKQGLLTETPKILGGAFSGRVAALGPKVVDRHDLAVGVAVSCFSGHLGIGAHQQYIVVPWWCLSKLEEKADLAAASTINDSLVTAVWSLTHGGIRLPLFESRAGDRLKPILVWGGSSSVGQNALQLLKLQGYERVYTTSSQRHAARMKDLGAFDVIDYNSADASTLLKAATKGKGFEAVLDCIGDVDASLQPSLRLVRPGGIVAAMLPYVRRTSGAGAGAGSQAVFMDVAEIPLKVPEDVTLIGVRTHQYHHDEEYKLTVQPDMIPRFAFSGMPYRLIGQKDSKASLAERLNEALEILNAGVSGERIVVAVPLARVNRSLLF